MIDLKSVKGTPGITETYAFKIQPALKKRFFKVCKSKELSTGRVMRALLEEFVIQQEGK